MLFVGCSTSPQKELIQDAETFLKSTLNDPGSYQPESFIIKDTLTVYEYEKNAIDIDMGSVDFFIDSDTRSIETRTELLKDYPTSSIFDNDRKELIKDRAELDSLMVVRERLVQKYDSLNKAVNDGSIKFIHLLATYRAKNNFGALIKEKIDIVYHYKEMKFEIMTEE